MTDTRRMTGKGVERFANYQEDDSMLHFRWCRVAGLVAVLCAARSVASAETCTLEIKRLELPPGSGMQSGSAQDWVYRSTSSQHISMQFGQRAYRPPNAEKEFRDLVKKEPDKYVSKEPFRGVAKLGSGKFAFVLDAKDEKSKGYDRLYFDLNANGDLTDDKRVDADPSQSPRVTGPEDYARHQFPRVDLSVPVEGKPVEYSFLASVYSYSLSGTDDLRYASAQFQAAAYRVGEVSLDGQKHKVALLDYNGNGRFDDQIKTLPNAFYSGGGIVAEMGDMLMVDPDPAGRPIVRRGYEHEAQQYISKLAKIGAQFYDVKVSPAGDQLTLTPSTLKVGYLTNPNGPFTGMIYGDHGFLPIRGDAGKPVAVPEGEWKLLAYGIQIAGWKPPPKPEKKDTGEKKEKPRGLLDSLSKALVGSKTPDRPREEPRYGPVGMCAVDAHGTAKCPPVTVRAGETVTLPFGPPYKPVVEANVSRWVGGAEVRLSMTVVGAGGEAVSNLLVDGYRPPKPEFTITDPKGEVVQKGSFEYG